MRTGRLTRLLSWAVLLVGVAVRTAEGNPVDTNYFANLAREHVFMVDKDGRCLDPAVEWGWSKRIPKFSVSNSLEDIEWGLTEWKKTTAATNPFQPPRAVVFIHGGMNPYGDSKLRLTDTVLMSALAASNCYPIFVVWNSGPFSAYAEHLFLVRQGEVHPVMGPITSPFILASDLLRGIARLPTTLFGRYYNDWETTELRSDSHLAKFFGDTRTAEWENFETLIHTNLSRSYHPPPKEGKARSRMERSVHLVEYFVTQPTKIVTLPLLDGLGTEAWDIMLRRTRTMFEPVASSDIDKMQKRLNVPEAQLSHAKKMDLVHRWLNPVAVEDEISSTNTQSGAMKFLAQNFSHWSTNCAFEFYGHSMGTIVLNEMFRDQPNIQATRIAYLGAACSIEDFQSAIYPYLLLHTNAQFYSLSLHRVRERDEYPLAGLWAPFLRDLIVRGSLLNWIDDILAKPNTISDRTLGAWENITSALPEVPEPVRDQIHFRGCAIEESPKVFWKNFVSLPGGVIEPQAHGDFTRSVFWSTNFLWPTGLDRLRLRPE